MDPVPSGLEYWDIPSQLLAHGQTSDFPPVAHNISRFAKVVDDCGFVQGQVRSEFYPYDARNSDICCTLFSVHPKSEEGD